LQFIIETPTINANLFIPLNMIRIWRNTLVLCYLIPTPPSTLMCSNGHWISN